MELILIESGECRVETEVREGYIIDEAAIARRNKLAIAGNGVNGIQYAYAFQEGTMLRDGTYKQSEHVDAPFQEDPYHLNRKGLNHVHPDVHTKPANAVPVHAAAPGMVYSDYNARGVQLSITINSSAGTAAGSGTAGGNETPLARGNSSSRRRGSGGALGTTTTPVNSNNGGKSARGGSNNNINSSSSNNATASPSGIPPIQKSSANNSLNNIMNSSKKNMLLSRGASIQAIEGSGGGSSDNMKPTDATNNTTAVAVSAVATVDGGTVMATAGKRRVVNLGRIAPNSVLATYITTTGSIADEVYHPETVIASTLVNAYTIGK